MGVVQVFGEVRDRFAALYPTSGATWLLTAEAAAFHGKPPRIVWELPQPGGEVFTRRHLGPGAQPTDQHQGILWTRESTCNIHCWLPGAGTTQVDDQAYEYVDDNEDPADGDTWLVQGVLNAIHQICQGGYEIGAGGFGNRSMANLGFLYVFQATFWLPVYRLKGNLTATISTTDSTIVAGG